VLISGLENAVPVTVNDDMLDVVDTHSKFPVALVVLDPMYLVASNVSPVISEVHE
jgi:hypothetical protein